MVSVVLVVALWLVLSVVLSSLMGRRLRAMQAYYQEAGVDGDHRRRRGQRR